MYDYFKLFIYDIEQINRIKAISGIDFLGKLSLKNGNLIEYPQTCKWQCFDFVLKSPTWLIIGGSIHKYWNNGTNETDFYFSDLVKALDRFCNQLQLNPELAIITNLECGVNVRPGANATSIIEDIICYKNKLPMRPYEDRDNSFHFIEFACGNYYIKVYDKGKQYHTVNTLRFEFKAKRSKEINPAGVTTLQDLYKKEVLQVLGRKLMQFFNYVVFTDDDINSKKLTKANQKVFVEMENPNKWILGEGPKTSTQYRIERKFISIVNKYSQKQYFALLKNLITEKVNALQENEKCNLFLPNYNGKTLQTDLQDMTLNDTIGKSYCKSCGRDISNQKEGSKFCSAKFVGEAAAHQCRNINSNPRNHFKNKIRGIQAKGVLFDIVPYLAIPANIHYAPITTRV